MTLMAAKQHYIRVTVHEPAKKHLEAQAAKLGQTQTELLSRLVEYFSTLEYGEQLRILGILDAKDRLASEKSK